MEVLPRMNTSLPRSWRSSLTLVGLLSATLAGTLNGDIVSIAYPALMRAYQVPFDLVVWSGVTTAVGLAALHAL